MAQTIFNVSIGFRMRVDIDYLFIFPETRKDIEFSPVNIVNSI